MTTEAVTRDYHAVTKADGDGSSQETAQQKSEDHIQKQLAVFERLLQNLVSRFSNDTVYELLRKVAQLSESETSRNHTHAHAQKKRPAKLAFKLTSINHLRDQVASIKKGQINKDNAAVKDTGGSVSEYIVELSKMLENFLNDHLYLEDIKKHFDDEIYKHLVKHEYCPVTVPTNRDSKRHTLSSWSKSTKRASQALTPHTRTPPDADAKPTFLTSTDDVDSGNCSLAETDDAVTPEWNDMKQRIERANNRERESDYKRTIAELHILRKNWNSLLSHDTLDLNCFDPESSHELMGYNNYSQFEAILRLFPDLLAKCSKCVELTKSWLRLANTIVDKTTPPGNDGIESRDKHEPGKLTLSVEKQSTIWKHGKEQILNAEKQFTDRDNEKRTFVRENQSNDLEHDNRQRLQYDNRQELERDRGIDIDDRSSEEDQEFWEEVSSIQSQIESVSQSISDDEQLLNRYSLEMVALSGRDERFSSVTSYVEKIGSLITLATGEYRKSKTEQYGVANKIRATRKGTSDYSEFKSHLKRLDKKVSENHWKLKRLEYERKMVMDDFLVEIELRPSFIRFVGDTKEKMHDVERFLQTKRKEKVKLKKQLALMKTNTKRMRRIMRSYLGSASSSAGRGDKDSDVSYDSSDFIFSDNEIGNRVSNKVAVSNKVTVSNKVGVRNGVVKGLKQGVNKTGNPTDGHEADEDSCGPFDNNLGSNSRPANTGIPRPIAKQKQYKTKSSELELDVSLDLFQKPSGPSDRKLDNTIPNLDLFQKPKLVKHLPVRPLSERMPEMEYGRTLDKPGTKTARRGPKPALKTSPRRVWEDI